MSFRVVRDVNVDTSKTSQLQVIPMVTTPQTTKGSISLDTTVNTFYGIANQGTVPISNSVLSTLSTGVTPAGIAILPNGTKAYVANNNNYGATYEGGAACDSVTVISLAGPFPIVTKTITDASFNQPYTVTISLDGTKAYVTNSNGATITIINTSSDTVTGTISGFDGPSGMVITPNGTTGYVNNYGGPIAGSGNGHTVSVVDLNLNTIINTIMVGQAPAAIAILPNGSYVYTVNYITGVVNGTISVINTSNNTSIVNAMGGLAGPFGIAITPNGLTACVTNFGSNNFSPFGTTLSIISLSTPTAPVITHTITLGIQPSGVAITPNGLWVYVSNYNTLYMDNVHFTGLTAGQGIVNAINLSTLEISPVNIVVGQSPNFIAITPNGDTAFVSNFTSNTVSVLALI
jgi:YVTN family beta-propeller protein